MKYMINFIQSLIKRKRHLSNDGCPIKCHICGNKNIHITVTGNIKYVSCSICKIILATYNKKWRYN